MSEQQPVWKKAVNHELALFLWLLLAGLTLLPLAVYFVGEAVFGKYDGSGFAEFYRMLHGELRDGEPALWFLSLSPYIIWQLLRLTVKAFRVAGSH